MDNNNRPDTPHIAIRLRIGRLSIRVRIGMIGIILMIMAVMAANLAVVAGALR